MKKINNITEFEQLIAASKPVLLKFYADWCSDCKAIQPILEGLTDEYGGQVDFAKIDIELLGDIAKQYSVKGIPAMFFLKNGEIVDQVKGVHPKALIKSKLDQLLA